MARNISRNIYQRRLSQLVRSTYLVEQLALDGSRPSQVVASGTALDFGELTDTSDTTYLNHSQDYSTERQCRVGTNRLPATEFYAWLECDSMAGDLPLGLYLEIASAERNAGHNNSNNLWHLLDHLASKPVTAPVATLAVDVIGRRSPIRSRTRNIQQISNHRERPYLIQSPTRTDRRQTRQLLAEVAGD